MTTLTGLTERQHKLADMIWQCDRQEDVAKFIRALPTEYKQDAELVHQLMIAAVFDEHMEVTDAVKDYCSSL
jgi:hypothetical protein